MGVGSRPVRECLRPYPAARDRGTIRARKRFHKWRVRRDQLPKDSAGGCTRQFPQSRRRLQETIESSSGAEDSLHLAAYFLVRDRFAAIQRAEALINLLPEPFIMVEIVRDQLLHDLIGGFSCLRGDSLQLGFQLRCQRNFHALIVGGIAWHCHRRLGLDQPASSLRIRNRDECVGHWA